MVLCKFFLQGYCRFGTKCVNEHLDVKHMIKTDIEGAITGKQWPLSTYGPFRDRPSIPNFIDDQSFEEVRMLCYQAKQKNFFEQFHQQFSKEVLDANNKMKALLQMTPNNANIVDVVIKIYDTPSDTSSSGVSVGKTSNNVSNHFGIANSAATSAGSIFAKSSANTPANNIFATNNNSTFTAANQAASGIFTTASPFTTQQQQQQTSVFGLPSKPTNSIFPVGNNTNTQQNSSIFAQPQAQSNLFAASAQQQPPQASTASGLFSQQNQNQFQQQSQQNSNIFRQPQQGIFAQASQTMQQQQPAQQQQGLFAQTAQQTTAGQGIFAQAAQQSQNMFSQAFQQVQQQTNPNIFQQNVSNAGAQQQQQTNSNIFQQNQPITTQQIHQPPTGLFQQAALQTQNNAVGQMNQQNQVNSTLYSRLEDLTADEIEAFNGDCFLPGKIPFNPPPRELIN